VWWEDQKLIKLKLVCSVPHVKMPDMKPGELGVTLDDERSVKFLPQQGFVGAASAVLSSQDSPETAYPLIFRSNGLPLTAFEKQIKDAVGPNHPARARYEKGQVSLEPEVSGVQLDVERLVSVVGKAVEGDHTVELPLTTAAKHVPDEALAKIKEVVASFSTHFPTYKRTRCSNIKLAARIIDGTVLMPGEQFSFNGVVGRRTLRAGFKLAGIYKNGQHDTGIGGGICQVSTTLYNSALLANLPIRRRSNHSLPVAYVPLGQDATVDYGNLDLVFENTYATPIAVSSYYEPGRLTFRLLGQKQNGLAIKIVRAGMRYFPEETQQVPDASLPAGRRRTVKPGSALRLVSTYRLVYQDGKLVKREPLGHSRYGGMPRIVAVGTHPAAVPIPPPATIPPPTTPVATGH